MEVSQQQELKEKIAALEAAQEGTRQVSSLPPPLQEGRPATTAIEIDNEALRDQVKHLQNKLSLMEEEVEQTREAAEIDINTLNERIERLQAKDEERQRELADAQREMDLILTSEKAASRRLQEVEEALRESTVALENAQAEVEVLRTELAVSIFAFFVQKTTHLLQDVDAMRGTQAVKKAAQLEVLPSSEVAVGTPVTLMANRDNQGILQELRKKEKNLLALRTSFEEKIIEIETLRGALNDAHHRSSQSDFIKANAARGDPKIDLSSTKEEIMGLKY